MKLFDDAFGDAGPAKLTKYEAFIGILIAADRSDGVVTEEEARGFATTVTRMKLYRDCTGDQINRFIDRAYGIINRGGVEKALPQFVAALPKELHKPVFANACDQVLSDGVVEDEEKQFINKLRIALGLSGDDAQSIAQAMVYKNQG